MKRNYRNSNSGIAKLPKMPSLDSRTKQLADMVESLAMEFRTLLRMIS